MAENGSKGVVRRTIDDVSVAVETGLVVDLLLFCGVLLPELGVVLDAVLDASVVVLDTSGRHFSVKTTQSAYAS